MSETLFDLSQYKFASGDSEAQPPKADRAHSEWIDAIGADPAWNKSNVTPTSALSSNEPATDAAHRWGSCAEFIITLELGQTVDVKFIPCLEGEYRMHSFDFTGPISPTGFKSRFVLAVEAKKYPHPFDYAQAYVQDSVARFEAGQQQKAKSTKRSCPVAEAQAPQGQATDDSSFTQEPTMAEDETTDPADSTHAKVEVVEELSPEEEADRQRLELKVERAFYESGKALVELRSRRLYRSTHKSFEDYCQDRFEFNRTSAHHKIRAAEIFDNLFTFSKQSGATESSENLFTSSKQVLPTKETQVRPLTKLEPEEQCQVWQQAVDLANGKVPTERTVKDAVLRYKGIVERLKEKHPSPPEFAQGDVVEIRVFKSSPLHPFNRMWGTVEHVGSFSYTVRVSIAKDTQQCKEEEMKRVDDEYTADIKSVAQRIAALIQFELEPIEYDILTNLQRSKCFTPTQLQLLEWLEHKH